LQKQISDAVPSPLTLQQSDIPDDVVQKLDLARQIIHAVELAFWILIGVIVFLIACMFAVWRQMKDSLRTLSIIFLIEEPLAQLSIPLSIRSCRQAAFERCPCGNSSVGPSFLQQSDITLGNL